MRAEQHHNAMNVTRREPLPGLPVVGRLFRAAILLSISLAFCVAASDAQDASGPLTPPPAEEHNVHRVTTSETTEPPPPLPPAEIIKKFSAKEDEYFRARIQYGYKKSIKVTQYGPDGKPSGEFQLVL